MDRFQYLLVLAAVLAVTLPLEFFYGFRVWRAPKRLAKALLPGFVIFTLWDWLAIERGHWDYNPTYVTGWSIGVVPVEELAFFVLVPAAAISAIEAVRAGLRRHFGMGDDDA